MAGSSAYLAHVTAIAIGRIGSHQIHALRLQQLLVIAQIAVYNSKLILQGIIRNALAYQLCYLRIAVQCRHLRGASAFQQHTYSTGTAAQLQYLGLTHNMRKVA